MIETEGLYGLCAVGINLSDMEAPPSFVFSTGDVIELEFDHQTGRLVLSRKNSIEREEIYLGMGKKEAEKLKFFVSIAIPGDSVEIIE